MNDKLLETSKEDLMDAIREYKDALSDLEEAQARVEDAKLNLTTARDEYEHNGATEEEIDQVGSPLDYYNL